MTAIREVGKINNDTHLIDITMMGVPKVTAIYLIEGGKKCLIDGGTSTEARYIIKELEKIDSFPPDVIIITHSHWDHTQAIPRLRKKAAKMGKEIEVVASHLAIPLLKDQSWNGVFGGSDFKNIENVTPVKEGDRIDLGEISLKIFEIPGHMKDHIAILDEKNRNLFLGDALGYKPTDDILIPAFMPPYCDKEAFLKSIAKLKTIEYDTLSLAHFGYIYGEEAKTILDESVATWEKWWNLFEENSSILDDPEAISSLVKQTVLTGTNTEQFGETLLLGVSHWLSLGYKRHKKHFSS